MRFGYKASAEQFAPRELLDLSLEAERLGLDTVAISDHFQPWRHHGGHSPAALPWLGALVASSPGAFIGTSVLTPTLRYEPAVIAQAFATLGCLAPGRVFLGVGTGEGLNETPVTGAAFPAIKERRMRLQEAIKLIRALWEGERVDFEGEYYSTEKATIYDRPDAAGADLRRGLRPAGRQARRPGRRRPDRHLRQGPRALRQAHLRDGGGRDQGRPRSRRPSSA